MSELKVLITKWGIIRRKITIDYDKLDDLINISPLERQINVNKCNEWLLELKNLNEKMINQKVGELNDEEIESEFESEIERNEYYNCKIYSILASIKQIDNNELEGSPTNINNAQNNNNLYASSRSSVDSFRTMLRQPVLPLPNFSGNYKEDLSKFLFEFESAIERYNYSEFDKLLLLKQQLSGRALVLVKSLSSDNLQYFAAKALLKTAFDSEQIQKSNVIRQMVKLKMDSNVDPFEYFSHMNSIRAMVNKLDMDA